ncbi:MAG: DNA-binding protein WhiA, partial [Lachnospiraceae bacterium]|nr:DNA-binding protein WhiA [Lachnospiraceae bacterium]
MKELSFTDRVKNEIKKHNIEDEKIDIKAIDRVKARKILRKKFVAIGEVNDPSKDTHLEFLAKNAKEANEIISYLDYIDISAKLSMKKKYVSVYIKDQSNIIRLLDMLGAKKLSIEYD